MEIKTIDYGAYARDLENLLSAILTEPTIMDSMKLRPDLILLDKGRIVLEVIQRQYRAGVKPDLITIANELAGKGVEETAVKNWATQELHAWSSSNWELYENRILDAWVKSRVLRLCYDLIATAPALPTTGDDLREMIGEAQSELATLENHDRMITAGQLITPVIKLVEARYKLQGALPGLSTGLPKIDTMTMGMQEQRLWVIGARPSQGKSALMGQIARHVALREKQKVGVITIESSATEFGMRSLAALGNLDAMKLNRGKLESYEFADVETSAEMFAGMGDNFVVYDKPRMTISEVWAVCRRMVVKYGIRVIFLDYLQRIKVPKQKTRFDEVAVATTELKEIARDLNITLVAMAQLRREADDKKPGLGDFQYTSQIEQDADVALLIWHEEGFTKAYDEKEKKEYRVPYSKSWLLAEKVRDGQTGPVQVVFKREVMTFGEVTNE